MNLLCAEKRNRKQNMSAFSNLVLWQKDMDNIQSSRLQIMMQGQVIGEKNHKNVKV